MSKLSHRAEASEKYSRKTENELARLKIRIEEKDRYIEKLKLEYDRIFHELKSYKRENDKINKLEVGTACGNAT